MASIHIGRRTDIGVAREATRGTAVSPTMWLPVTSVSFDQKVDKTQTSETLGNINEMSGQADMKKFAEGTFEGEIRSHTIGYLLYAALGSLSTGSAVSSVYPHTFSLDNDSNLHQSLSLCVQDPNVTTTLFPRAMLNKLDFEFSRDAFAKYTADFRSNFGKDWTSQAVSYTATENKFHGRMLEVRVSDTLANAATAAKTDVVSVKLSIEKNVADIDSLGTVQAKDIANQSFKVSGEITLNYQNTTQRAYLLGNTYRAVELKLIDRSTTIGGASANPDMTIYLPRVGFTTWEPDRPINEITTETLQFTAYQDLTNSLDAISSIVLYNTKAAYTS